jgi:DNA-binding beta-propeller fold protein YncE
MMVSLIINTNCQSQDTTKLKITRSLEKGKIQYVSQWPTVVGGNQKITFKQKINDLIFGKKNLELKRPVAMVATNQNTYWILDQQNNAVFQVNKESASIPRFIEKKNFNFASLVGMCNYHKNEFLFTDSYLNKIFLIRVEKKECVVLNDSLKLNKPTGIAYAPLHNEVWVVETGEHRLVVLNEKGEVIKKIGSRGNGKGEFNFPTHIWIDKQGYIYVVDAMNFRVQVFNSEGAVISIFGSNGDATGYFASPKGIATDSYGHIYIADALFHVVQVFDINGRFLETFGSQGQDAGQFWMPSGIYIDERDKIYVSDTYNSRIQIFQLTAGDKK